MKESRQNDREIRVQDNIIMEGINAKSPLTLEIFLMLLLHAKPKDKES